MCGDQLVSHKGRQAVSLRERGSAVTVVVGKCYLGGRYKSG